MKRSTRSSRRSSRMRVRKPRKRNARAGGGCGGGGNEGACRRTRGETARSFSKAERDDQRQGDGRLHEPAQLCAPLRCAHRVAWLPRGEDRDDRQSFRRPARVECRRPHHHEAAARRHQGAREGHRRSTENRDRAGHVADGNGHPVPAHPLHRQADANPEVIIQAEAMFKEWPIAA